MKKLLPLLLTALLLCYACSNDDTADNPEPEVTGIAEEVLVLINAHREAQGLDVLTMDDAIVEEASLHSRNMADGSEEFGHNGFETRIERLSSEISFSGSAENVASNRGTSNPAQQAVDSWLNSPGHLANIEGNYDLTGIGVAEDSENRYYFTQIFLRSN